MKSLFQFAKEVAARAAPPPEQVAPAPRETLQTDALRAREAVKLPDDEAVPILLELAKKHPRGSEIQLALARVLLRRDPLDAKLLPPLAGTTGFLPPKEIKQLEQALAPFFDVRLNSPREAIEEAWRAALIFQEYAGEVRGVARTLGIAELSAPNAPTDMLAAAIHHFEQALVLEDTDEESNEGRRRAMLRIGRHEALNVIEGADEGMTAAFQRTLRWVEGEGTAMEPPLTSEALERFKPGGDLAWEKDFCVARLRLIEGDNAGAAELFNRLADARQEAGRVAYYGAWADLLSGGDGSLVEAWLEDYPDWAGAWTLVSRLWDLKPDATSSAQSRILAGVDPDFARLLEARRALALDQDYVTAPQRPGRYLEEEIEVLRIRLGQACLRRDATGLSERMTRPLFRVLPKSDRLFWQAMHEHLAGEVSVALKTFETAAGMGHRRAAWAAGVIHAERNDIAAAASWSRTGLAGRRDERSELWQQWIEAASGNVAAKDRLRNTAGASSKRTTWAGANFAVDQAHILYQSGDVSAATAFMERALADCQTEDHPDFAVREEAALLAASIRFWLNPQRGAPLLSSQWEYVMHLAPSPRRTWFLWLVILAKLTRNDPRNVPEAAAELRQLLQQSGPLCEPARNALVRVLGSTVSSATHPAASKLWLETLQEFPGGTLESEKQLAVALAAWRRCEAGSLEDSALAQPLQQQAAAEPDNVLLALIAAFVQAGIGAPAVAAALLANTASATSSAWLNIIAEGLTGKDDAEVASASGSSLNPASASGLVLQAALLFRNSEREKGFESVLAAWRLAPAHVPKIFNVSRWAAVICAASAGNTPPHLLGVIKDLGRAATDPADLERLARCAAVLNNAASSVELWRRSVKAGAGDAGPGRLDFARYLCHLASIETRAGRNQQALDWIEEAAAQLPAQAAEAPQP